MAYDSVFKAGLFAGQTIMVTGGGSGIGRCTAHELAALRAHVVLVGRKLEKLEKTAAEIREDGGSVSLQVCDIREEESVKAMVAAVLAERGSIEHLVNNAGGQYPSPLASINQKGFETVIRTNLVGGFLVAREVFNQSMSKTGGSIVNMLADMWGGMPGMGHSGAARAGMENFTKTAAVEWGHAGVRVNAVAPGWVASSGMDSYGPAMAPMILSLKDNLPMRRLGLEAEISSVICFLLSPGAAFVTGVTVAIDGGAGVNNPVWPKAPHEPAPSFNGFHRATTPKVLQGL